MKTAADNKVEVTDSVNTYYNLANGTIKKTCSGINQVINIPPLPSNDFDFSCVLENLTISI